MLNQIGTFALKTNLTDLMLTAQKQFDTTSIQLSSGKTSQTFAGISGKSSTMLNMAEGQVKANQYLGAISISDTRADTSVTALQAVSKAVTDMKKYIDSNPPPIASDTTEWATKLAGWMNTVGTMAQSYLGSLVTDLNASDGVQYIFAGTNYSTPPFTLLGPGTGANPNPPIASQTTFGGIAAQSTSSNAGYRFQINSTGTTTNMQVKVSDNTNVIPQTLLQTNTASTPANYTTTAPYVLGGNPAVNAIQQALSGLVNLADLANNTTVFGTPTAANVATIYANITNAGPGAYPTTGVLPMAKSAFTNALNGNSNIPITDASGTTISTSTPIQSLQGTITTLNLTKQSTAAAKQYNSNFIEYSTTVTASIINIDYAATAAQLQADQLALNSSYSALSKVGSMSLLNYMS